MHWIWRVAIAVGAGSVIGTAWVLGSFRLFQPKNTLQRAFNRVAEGLSVFIGDDAATAMLLVSPPIVLAFVVYGVLTRYLVAKRYPDGQARCRKCGYILRDIPEPRCSECGERI